MREDMYARSGPTSFSLDTTYEKISTGSTHRYQIGKLSVSDIRSMFRNTTRMIIARARQNGELNGKLWGQPVLPARGAQNRRNGRATHSHAIPHVGNRRMQSLRSY